MMNKHLILFEIVVLIICVGISGCIGPRNYIEAIRVDDEPDVYINMNE